GTVKKPRRMQLQRLYLKKAKMFVETSSPDEVDAIPGLQQRLHLARAASLYHSKMTPAGTRHHFQNGAGFAMLPRAQNDSFVAPFHRCSLPSRSVRFQGEAGRNLRRQPVVKWSLKNRSNQ